MTSSKGAALSIILVLCLCANAPAAFAEASATQSDAPEEAPVSILFNGYTLTPELTEEGEIVLDEDGNPVLVRLPVTESIVTPGETVLYVVNVENLSEEPVEALAITTRIAAEMILDPYSIIGPEGLQLDWSHAENPTDFSPVFVKIDGQDTLAAELELLHSLRLTLPDLLPGTQAEIEYSATLR